MSPWRDPRWNVALVVALLASATGVLFEESVLLYAAIPPVTLAAYSRVARVPEPTIDIDRTFDPDTPAHGQEVEVTVTLRNAGERTLPDVRVADGVAPMLPVVEGTARHATVLPPNAEATYSYTVVAAHGVHRFEPASVVCRDTSAGQVVEIDISVEADLACRSPVRSLPFPRLPRHRGATEAVANGEGTEFSKTRAYRPGDPPGRIDWNRYAKDRELTTISFREDRRRTVVLALDARASCYRSPGENDPHAVFYERAAARELLAVATAAGDRIGLVVSGPTTDWIAPDAGQRHAATIRRALESVPLSPPETNRSGDGETNTSLLRSHLESGTDVVFLSPLIDRRSAETARALQEAGHRVTVVSPDVTGEGSYGQSIARLERDNRIDALRRSWITVVDWDLETPLKRAIRAGMKE
ncbi:DUF58 domain-containing protein [Saliphagus sp. LR7]|uniref:DUF58 domain-containing protein n=1 Tax=Saliphagus sp. LR7 TaxID=2282654 RepID=UPI000DF743AA|nr:DUF58 domain-containing protein [Saliphagus sp. LR7]